MRKQQGFIQNFIIPGVILLGVIVAGLAMLSSSPSSSTEGERVSMMATAIIGQGASLTGALQRAEGDGGIARAPASLYYYKPAEDSSSIPAVNRLLTPLVDARFVDAPPSLPAEISKAAVSYSGIYAYNKYQVAAKDGLGSDLGTATADDVLYIGLGTHVGGDILEKVCYRINAKLHGSPPNGSAGQPSGSGTAAGWYAAVPTLTGANGVRGASEGCFIAAGDNSVVYYKVIHAR